VILPCGLGDEEAKSLLGLHLKATLLFMIVVAAVAAMALAIG
jgi:hypothetical protein